MRNGQLATRPLSHAGRVLSQTPGHDDGTGALCRSEGNRRHRPREAGTVIGGGDDTTASIRTHNPARDDDLRSSNFLEVDKYPTITFKSTGVEAAGQDHYELRGDLTIKGNTHPVVLEVTKYGEFNDPAMMGHRIGYSAHTQINRKDYGLSFNMVLDGRFVVSEQVQIMIEGELVEQKDPAGPPRLD